MEPRAAEEEYGFDSWGRSVRFQGMKHPRYIYWQQGEEWLGYFEEYPDYWTQGKSLAELKANLGDLYREVTSGEIPHIRRAAQLVVA